MGVGSGGCAGGAGEAVRRGTGAEQVRANSVRGAVQKLESCHKQLGIFAVGGSVSVHVGDGAVDGVGVEA